jgi:predicted transcriptional regulator
MTVKDKRYSKVKEDETLATLIHLDGEILRKGRKMNQKVLHIGIISYEDYKKRSLAIARGKYRPQPDEPKIWFESLQSMAQILSNENQLLLKTILERKPESLKELEAATGRSSSNLSRTLKTMARYGIVKMEKVRRNIKPVVEATDFTVQFGLYANGRHENGVSAARN